MPINHLLYTLKIQWRIELVGGWEHVENWKNDLKNAAKLNKCKVSIQTSPLDNHNKTSCEYYLYVSWTQM